MESSLQKIIAAIVGVFILFIVPVYMAFEKVDDISYSVTLKHVQTFVDNVREKGYISPDMYTNLVMNVYSTNNSFDIKVEHVKKRYDPAIYVYDRNGKILFTLDYDKYITQYESGAININGTVYQTGIDYTLSAGHSINEERITDKQIVDKLFKGLGISKSQFLADYRTGNIDLYDSLIYMNENSYVMNEGDKVEVTVKNTNQTIASLFYSILTANIGNNDAAKIYVKYGGNIKNSGTAILENDSGSVNTPEGKLFKFRGKAEEVNLDVGTYEIECWGARGGGTNYTNAFGNAAFSGGKGAYAKAKLTLTEEKTVFVYVGGQGKAYDVNYSSNGGWNGGGDSYLGYGGGGASDVRLVEDDEYNSSRHTKSLVSRLILAGGGGGGSLENNGNGGYAGNSSGDGAALVGSQNYVGKGATVNIMDIPISNGYLSTEVDETTGIMNVFEYENGNLGSGGKADYLGAGGGGGGYIGGSASHNENAGGGGGSSYVYDNHVPALATFYGLDSLYSGITVSDTQIINGNTLMPNPLAFLGVSEIKGNDEYGYIKIRKIS